MRGFDVELRRVGIFQITGVAGKFDAGGLHAQTNSKIRRARAPGIRDGPDHSFDAALAKATRHQDGVKISQPRLVSVVHQFFRFYPPHVDAQIVGAAAATESFAQTLISTSRLTILPTHPD